MKCIVLSIISIFLIGMISGCDKDTNQNNDENEEIVYSRYDEAEFEEAKIGKYYFDGDIKSEYIEVLEGNKLQFVKYDKDEFTAFFELYLSDFEFDEESRKEELHKDFQERLLSPYDYYIENQDGVYVLLINDFCGIKGSYMSIKYNNVKNVLLINGKEYIYFEE